MTAVEHEPRVRPALRRRTEDRLVSGVAGGLADWLNASPFFVRVVLALLFTFDPSAWAYAGATLLLPARGSRPPRGWTTLESGWGGWACCSWAPLRLLANEVGVDKLRSVVPLRTSCWSLYGLVLPRRPRSPLSADYVRGRPRTPGGGGAATVRELLPLAISLAMLVSAGVTMLFTDVRWERVVPVCVIVGRGGVAGGLRGRGRPRPLRDAGRGGRGCCSATWWRPAHAWTWESATAGPRTSHPGRGTERWRSGVRWETWSWTCVGTLVAPDPIVLRASVGKRKPAGGCAAAGARPESGCARVGQGRAFTHSVHRVLVRRTTPGLRPPCHRPFAPSTRWTLPQRPPIRVNAEVGIG